MLGVGVGVGPNEFKLKSEYDACITCENVKYGPLTPELTELICERQVRRGQKTGVFCRISLDILDRFSQSFHHMKVLFVQMMDLWVIFSDLSRNFAMTTK